MMNGDYSAAANFKYAQNTIFLIYASNLKTMECIISSLVMKELGEICLRDEKMEKYDLVAPCGDYCGGCGQYNELIVKTAKQMKEFADPDTMDRYKRFKEIGFEKWVEEQMQKAKEGYEIHLQKVASLKP